MTAQRCFCKSIVLTLVLVARLSHAQVLTGTLLGTVKDESGGVLPDASVRLSSPALIGGRLRLSPMKRGSFGLSRFQQASTPSTSNCRASPCITKTTCQLTSRGPSSERSFSKSAQSPSQFRFEAGTIVDQQRSGLASRFGQETLSAIPVRRFSMFDLIRATPGVSPTSASSGADPSVSVFGSSVNENLYLLDGTNFTCPCSGGPQPQPDVDVIQEVHVDSIGASAEFGNIQGGVFNVVTKQGGNLFAPDFSYYGQTRQSDEPSGRTPLHPLQRAAD